MQEQIEQTHIFVASPIKAETSSVHATLAASKLYQFKWVFNNDSTKFYFLHMQMEKLKM